MQLLLVSASYRHIFLPFPRGNVSRAHAQVFRSTSTHKLPLEADPVSGYKPYKSVWLSNTPSYCKVAYGLLADKLIGQRD